MYDAEVRPPVQINGVEGVVVMYSLWDRAATQHAGTVAEAPAPQAVVDATVLVKHYGQPEDTAYSTHFLYSNNAGRTWHARSGTYDMPLREARRDFAAMTGLGS
jgi:hypothetical protein